MNDPIKNASIRKDTVSIDIWYPRSADQPKYIEVGLMDVRAADNVRLSYDFERDGWKVEQAAVFAWDINDEVQDAEWAEVAFIPAWGRQRHNPIEGDDCGCAECRK